MARGVETSIYIYILLYMTPFIVGGLGLINKYSINSFRIGIFIQITGKFLQILYSRMQAKLASTHFRLHNICEMVNVASIYCKMANHKDYLRQLRVLKTS